MEINQPLDSDATGSGLQVSPSSYSNLSTAATWSKFLAIVTFVFLGFAVIGAFGIGAMLATIGGEMAAYSALITILYLAFLGIASLPALYLFRFSNQMKAATQYNSQQDLDSAFTNLKSYFKFVGMLTAIFIGLYFLLIIGSMLFGASMNNF